MEDKKWNMISIVFGAIIMAIILGGFILQPLDLATCEARGGIVLTSPNCDSI